MKFKAIIKESKTGKEIEHSNNNLSVLVSEISDFIHDTDYSVDIFDTNESICKMRNSEWVTKA